jgi:broad specificity phosphatase PhoE
MPVVYLIRHGQASFGAEDYDVLSPVGHQQSELLAAALLRRGVVRPDRIVAGTLKRQQATASTCAAVAAYEVPAQTDPRLNEYDHVVLLREELDRSEAGPRPGPAAGRAVQQALDAALLGWTRSGRPGSDGRTFEQWRDDAVAAQREFLGSLGRGETGLVFTSGGVVAAICADLLGLGADGFVALNRVTVNTGITKIIGGRSGTSLLSFNDHAHLEGPADLLTYR